MLEKRNNHNMVFLISSPYFKSNKIDKVGIHTHYLSFILLKLLVSSLWNFSHARVTTKLIQLGTIVVCVCVSTHTNTMNDFVIAQW